jgi:signal transduction histidine kinase
MQNLMNDLLDFAQIENNCFKLNKEYYNLLELVQQSFLILDHISKKKNITFVLPTLSKD